MDETSAAGPDGMNVLHLRILIRSTAQENPQQSGEITLFKFPHIFADARFFPPVSELFAPSRQVGICKPKVKDKPPGIRPIAIGIFFRRPLSILVLTLAVAQASGLLKPRQTAKRMAAGTKVLVHAYRQVLKHHHPNPGKVSFRVDAENAFNWALRAGFLRLVCVHAEAAAKLAHAVHGAQPFLSVGDTILRSEEGTQEGDPLGKLLSALIIQPLIKMINTNCTLDYNFRCPDDSTINGDIDQVTEAYELIIRDGPGVNFQLVGHKTRLW